MAENSNRNIICINCKSKYTREEYDAMPVCDMTIMPYRSTSNVRCVAHQCPHCEKPITYLADVVITHHVRLD